jgi:EmrB/QacA subfamily drug resistance transporter
VKKTVLLIATLSAFLTPFMSSSINIALPSIGKEFSMSAVLLSWVATSYLLTAALFLVPFGRVADIYGIKKIFTIGILFYSISSLMCCFSSSAFFLISCRILQGISSSMIFATGTAMVTSVFPVGERGRALGINAAAVYLGLSLGPFLGGLLTQHFGWRSVFFFNVPLGVIVIVMIFWKLKGEWADAKGEKFDFTGSIIYSISLTAIMYGFSQLPRLTGTLLIPGGFIGMLAFIKWEEKAQSPVFEINILRTNTVFAFSNLAALINYSATFAVAFLLSLYLQYIKGFNPQNAGIILVAQPFMQSIFSPFAGKLSDKFEPRIVASIGMGLTVPGLILFAFLDNATSLILIVANLMLLGFGFALFSAPNTNAIMSSVSKKFYGIASGTLGTMRLTGMTFSMGITMFIFALHLGKLEIVPEYYPLFLRSVKTIFIIFASLCIGGTFASLVRGKLH